MAWSLFVVLWRAIDIPWFSGSWIYFPAIPSFLFFTLLLIQSSSNDLGMSIWLSASLVVRKEGLSLFHFIGLERSTC